MNLRTSDSAYLLVSDGESALCLLVRLRVVIQLLNCSIVQDFLCKLDVALCVLVSRVNLGVVWQSGQCFVQRFLHLLRCSFKEASATAYKQGVAGEDCAVIAIFEVEADAVLSVAWCVKCRKFYGSNVETCVVCRSFCDQRTVFAANDGKVECFFLVTRQVLQHVHDKKDIQYPYYLQHDHGG